MKVNIAHSAWTWAWEWRVFVFTVLKGDTCTLLLFMLLSQNKQTNKTTTRCVSLSLQFLLNRQKNYSTYMQRPQWKKKWELLVNTHASCLLKLQSFISNCFFFFSCLLSTLTVCVIPSNTVLLLSFNLLQSGIGIPRHKWSTYQMQCFCNRAMLGEHQIKIPLDGMEALPLQRSFYRHLSLHGVCLNQWQ